MYKLSSENLTNLGGPMGSEYTFDNWTKYFNKIENAKKYALKDYRRNGGKQELVWKTEADHYHTQDLGFVMYYIRKVEAED